MRGQIPPTEAEHNTAEVREQASPMQSPEREATAARRQDGIGSEPAAQAEGWTTVGRRPKVSERQQVTGAEKDPKGRIKGTRQGESRLKAAQSNAWLYLGRLNPETTEEDIENYLKENGVSGRISCKMVSSTYSRSAFKIGIPMIELDKVYEEAFWPADVMCRPFWAPWRYKGRP